LKHAAANRKDAEKRMVEIQEAGKLFHNYMLMLALRPFICLL
jgi:hypothetical protein